MKPAHYHYQFDIDETGSLPNDVRGNIVGPMGEFYCHIDRVSETFIEFIMQAINKESTT